MSKVLAAPSSLYEIVVDVIDATRWHHIPGDYEAFQDAKESPASAKADRI